MASVFGRRQLQGAGCKQHPNLQTPTSFISGLAASPCLPRLSSTQLRHVQIALDNTGRQPARLCSIIAQGQPGLLNLPLNRDLEEPLPGFASIREAMEDFAAGKFLVVIDDEDRENEGDLIMAADKVTTEAMAFMVEYTSGVVCIAMESKDLERLRLPQMVSSAENEDRMLTAFTITVDLNEGTTTGISASDRAKTVVRMADPSSTAAEFRRPGHIFPLRYRQGGVIVRPGHTEASVDLARLAGSYPAGILCEIVNKPDGSMARTPELLQFAKQHGLKCITIADLIRYRLRREQLVTHVSSAQVTTRYGPLTAHTFTSALDSAEHVVFVAGDVKAQGGQGVHVAVHREQVVSDVLGIAPAGTSGVPSLDSALAQVAAEGRGAVVYLRPRTEGEPSPSKEVSSLEGSRNGSAATNGNGNGSAASSSSSNGRVTRSANGLDLRAYGIAAQMLKELGVTSAEVIGSDATAAQALTSCGLPARLAGTSAPSSLSLPHLNGDSKAAAAVNGVAAHSLAGAGC